MESVKINDKWTLLLPKEKRNQYERVGGWERARLEHMSKRLGAKDLVYYVGAETGEMPALIQTWGAEVVLIEPSPKFWRGMKKIWTANNLSTPSCFEGFASNVSRHHYLGLLYKKWPLHADIKPEGQHGFKELYLEADNYPQIRLADIPDFFPKLYPTAVSIDAEGSERRVIEGLAPLLERTSILPKIWLSGHPEFMFHQWGEYLSDLRGYIKSFGYKEELIDYDHEVHLYYEADK